MLKHTLLPLFLVFCLASGTLVVADGESARSQIRQWVQQLGDESFLVRQRAETLLIHAGIQAASELQRARQSHDVEIACRAEYVLSQIEQTLLDGENRNVVEWIQIFMVNPNPISQARMIWSLADPATTPGSGIEYERGFDRGEGLPTLCRLVCFEQDASLRLEVAKTLIASPPLLPTLRQKWYRYIRDHFPESGDDDELHQSLARFAKLWCELDDAETKTTPIFQDQVRKVGAETLQLLKRKESTIPRGSKMDMLLHYAVAELQDAAGLTEDRDRTVAAVLALQPEPIDSAEQIQEIGLHDNALMYEHWYVGWWLKQRFRLHWAMAHFRNVMESGDIVLRVGASAEAAESALYLADYSAAAALWDRSIGFLNSPDYTKEYDPSNQLHYAQRQRAYCLAENAAAEENWTAAQDIIMQLWAVPNVSVDSTADVDIVILAYRLCKQNPDVGQEFKDCVESMLKRMWQTIVLDYDNHPELRIERMPGVCNLAAWLLANTDGDYQSATTLIEAALKIVPDDVSFLDTLAHVHYLGGKIDEAILTQEQVVR
ncbi:MAG: hypothetical protein LBI05_04570, partial [Planctomycetaceae bacterium]|nr:hypothetical protein [Planctomycetaceae bacterium]